VGLVCCGLLVLWPAEAGFGFVGWRSWETALLLFGRRWRKTAKPKGKS
jgi:hypothetical protein